MAAEPVGDLVDPVTVIRRWGLALLVAALVGGVLGGLYGGRVQGLYEANVVVLVGPVVPDSELLEGTTDLARTYGEILESNEVIRQAVQGTGVGAGQVDVAASAGRGSATINVRIRTPKRDATVEMAIRIVEVLREIVADNRADLDSRFWGVVDPTIEPGDLIESNDEEAVDLVEQFPIGSAITVIDDGTERVSDRSLGPLRGGLLGALAGVLMVAAVGLGMETRRADDPISRAVEKRFGHDLGRLAQLPLVPGLLLRRRWRRSVVTGKSRRQDVRYTAEATAADLNAGLFTTVFLAVPSSHPAYLRAVIQLCDGFESPPTIIDLAGVISDQFAPATFARLRSERFVVSVDDRVAAQLIQPGPDRHTTDQKSARRQMDELRIATPTVFILVPVDTGISRWLWWASVADRCIALVRPKDLRPDTAAPFVDRIELSAVPVEGAIALSRRWFVGRTGRVQISVVGGPVEAGSGRERVGQAAITR